MQKEIISNLVDEVKVFKRIKLKPVNNWHRLMQRFGLENPIYVDIKIKGATLRTVQKISLIILEMQNQSNFKDEDQIFDLMQSNVYDQARIIATAVHNSPEPTPKYLVDAILDNFTNTESKEIVAEVYGRLDVQSFFGSMALIKNLKIVTDTQEIPVSQPLSEVSS